MDRDSMGERPRQSLVSPERFKPLERSKKDDPTFSKPDAYALVGRLAATWSYCGQDGRDDILAQEFLAQFDGYSPELVQRAATIAIGKCTEFAPPAGAIKAELRTLTEVRPSERRPSPHGCGPHPSYLKWAEKDRALTREAAEKAKHLPPDEVCFGKTVKRAVAQLEE